MARGTRPDDKNFRIFSFAIHATRGIIREQRVRRTTMLVLLGLALGMLAAGTTLLEQPLNRHEHLGLFLLFWLVCAWLTITALLIAMFDLLILRSQVTAARKELRKEVGDGRNRD